MSKYNGETQKEIHETELAGEGKTGYKTIYDNTCSLQNAPSTHTI